MKAIKERIQALARESGLADTASICDFLDWCAAEAKKAGKR